MAQQAGVGAILLPEAQSHFRVRNVVDLVGPRAKSQRVHNRRHVASDAAAACGRGAVMGMRRGRRFVGELCMAANTHLIRLIFELQRRLVGGEIVAVGIVTAPATHLSLAETLRAFERFHDKRRLAESPVFIKAFAGKFAERDALILPEEIAAGGIVQFAQRLAHGRLHVALGADADKFPVADPLEVNRRIERSFVIGCSFGDGGNVARRRTVAHLTANSRLAEFEMIRF